MKPGRLLTTSALLAPDLHLAVPAKELGQLQKHQMKRARLKTVQVLLTPGLHLAVPVKVLKELLPLNSNPCRNLEERQKV